MTLLALEQLRYRRAMLAQLKLTAGKHGRPALPTFRPAWADTPARAVVGFLLLAAASIAWMVVLG